jgi:hypothetical protein
MELESTLSPDTLEPFRRGQLLVLLAEVDGLISLDRLGYLEFFTANPHLAVADDKDRTRLELAGFTPNALSYQSASERFANRRSRLRSDLAALTAWGYVAPGMLDGRIACGLTPHGRDGAAALSTFYAEACRTSCAIIRPLLQGTETAVARRVAGWLSTRTDERLDLLEVQLDFDFGSPLEQI